MAVHQNSVEFVLNTVMVQHSLTVLIALLAISLATCGDGAAWRRIVA
ncbi:hypothetical protein KNO81_37155 [Paraburkholderia sediminicola]|jgi:hypothetical protein|nr:hypothetical protein [Paraburkholderia sediminicola]